MSCSYYARSLLAFALFLQWPFASHAATTSYSDTEFVDANWTSLEVADTTPNNSFSFVAQQVLGGGNPNAYRRVTQTLNTPTPSSIASGHLLIGGTFDPGKDGSFLSLDASLDGISEVGNPAGAMGYGVLLEQDGNYFAGPLVPAAVLNGVGWGTLTGTGLLESDFIPFDGASVLDLSDNGSVVTVGFFVSNGTFGTPSVNVGGVDNWSVTIHATPLPQVPSLGLYGIATTSLLLLLTGGFVAWRRAHRYRGKSKSPQ